jgi:hypothetical protein
MYIAASVEVPLTVTQVSCLGTTSDPGTQIIQLQDCKGTEIKDNDPARIFDFNCTFQNDFMSWSVVGKVTLHA